MPLPHWQPLSSLCIKTSERPLPGLRFVVLTKQRVNAFILQLHKVYSCFAYFRSQGADRTLANFAVKLW